MSDQEDKKQRSASDYGGGEDFWFESINEKVDNNEQRGVENRIYLGKIDVKVTWIVRILGAIITAGAVRYSVMVFGL